MDRQSSNYAIVRRSHGTVIVKLFNERPQKVDPFSSDLIENVLLSWDKPNLIVRGNKILFEDNHSGFISLLLGGLFRKWISVEDLKNKYFIPPSKLKSFAFTKTMCYATLGYLELREREPFWLRTSNYIVRKK